MKIESVRIENFRGFKEESIVFNDYCCFVGPNGSGKSTVLAALNVFFRQYKDSKTDLSILSVEDFHHKNVDEPIKITVTFTDLSAQAKDDLSDYVRQDRLVVSSIARYDTNTGRAEVKQYGNRLGMAEFKVYFEADKAGASAIDLRRIYGDLRGKFSDLIAAKSKDDMAAALREYESQYPGNCALLPSEDQFYGATKGASRLGPHVQWIFVPAVKDITQEGEETRTSALGQLLARTIRSKVNFSEKIGKLREDIKRDYQQILDSEQTALDGLSVALENKLKSWAHPNTTAKVMWKQDPDKSIKVEDPWAYIRIGERGFEGELARFGHGLQRSYMLTLLHELAITDDKTAPTLIMGIEEPELYQHPPQARYLSEVLHDLATHGSQILVCSHSPLFIPGDDFESVRVVRDTGNPAASCVAQIKYDDLAKLLKEAGHKLLKESGMLAKLYPTLNPAINEMFFCKVLVLTEGVEDVAYISTYITLCGHHGDFRHHGCHIVPVGKKSELIKPLAMAKLLRIPVFVVFDADTDAKSEHIEKHKKDNRAILALSGYGSESEWPDDSIQKSDLVAWKTNIAKVVEEELGTQWTKHISEAVTHYGHAGNLDKNPLAISRALEGAWKENVKSQSLISLVENVINFANSSNSGRPALQPTSSVT